MRNKKQVSTSLHVYAVYSQLFQKSIVRPICRGGRDWRKGGGKNEQTLLYFIGGETLVKSTIQFMAAGHFRRDRGTHTYAQTHKPKRKHTCFMQYTYTYTHTRTLVRTRIYTHIRTHTYAHTHTHTHTHSLSLSLFLFLSLSPFLFLSQTITRKHTHTNAHTCTRSHTHTDARDNTHTHTHTHTHTYLHAHTHKHAHTHARALAHTLSFTHSLSHTYIQFDTGITCREKQEGRLDAPKDLSSSPDGRCARTRRPQHRNSY